VAEQVTLVRLRRPVDAGPELLGDPGNVVEVVANLMDGLGHGKPL